ncbi:MAG: hypothetical protein P4L33_02085 [Capsulimonadaceae bacterium]|nr:hypothetical protein [Capsulimonadaceae bacterium]
MIDKQGGSVVDVTIWQVTQIAPPDSIEMAIRPDSPYKDGFLRICGDTTPYVDAVSPNLLRIKHATAGDYKIGADSPIAALTALYGKTRLTIAGPKVDGDYPEGASWHGFPVEIWNSGTKDGDYNELELLSPIRVLKSGENYHYTVTWALSREQEETSISAIKLLR